MKNASHILLVDDEPLILSSMRDLLEVDYVVHLAENGKDALEILGKYPIKVIISDERMPQMRGHQLLKRTKQISPNTIRVLLTGYADLESVMNSVNGGEIFRYLNKPCRNDALLNVVRLGVQIHDRLSSLKTASSPTTKTDKSEIKPDKTSQKHDALFVGFTSDDIARLQLRLSKDFTIKAVLNIEEALKVIGTSTPSVIVSELTFDDYEGLDFLQSVLQVNPQLVIIVLTETVDVSLITKAVNELNVFRYLPKNATQEDIEKALMDAATRSTLYKKEPLTNLKYTASQIEPPQQTNKASEELMNRLKAIQEKLRKE